MERKIKRKSEHTILQKCGFSTGALLSGQKSKLTGPYAFQFISNPTLGIIPLI